MLPQRQHEECVERLEYYVTLCKPWLNSLRPHNRILQGLFTCQPCHTSLKSSHAALCVFPTSFGPAVGWSWALLGFLQVIRITFTLTWFLSELQRDWMRRLGGNTIFGKTAQLWGIVLRTMSSLQSSLPQDHHILTPAITCPCNQCEIMFQIHICTRKRQRLHYCPKKLGIVLTAI